MANKKTNQKTNNHPQNIKRKKKKKKKKKDRGELRCSGRENSSSPTCGTRCVFLTLQDKHNIRTLSLNIKFICNRCETGIKSSPKARYSACF
jgi:hypothetical protein